MKKKLNNKNHANTGQLRSYGFILPGFAFMVVFMAYPLVYSLILSFTDYNFAFDKSPTFIGVQNIYKMFHDTLFLDSLRNTFVFTLAFFPSVMVISLIIALMLNYGVKGSPVFRTCIFLPVVVPMSLSGIIFQWILNSDFGLLNFILRNLGMGWAAKNWLGDPKWAMISIVAVSLWKNIGMLTILFLAGLQAISASIEEAAVIDGANVWQRIVHVVLPNLKQSYITCGIWATLQSVKVFEQPFIMTNGGPGSSTLVLYQYTWQNAFKFFEMGYASTIAYFIGIIILIISAVNVSINREDRDSRVKVRT